MHRTTSPAAPSASNPGARSSRAVRRVGAALVVVAALATGCGSDDSDDDASGRSDASTTTTTTAADTTTPTDQATVPEPDDSGGTPSAWPSGVPLPTAVDPTGASIPDSLVTDDDPPDGDVVMFTFAQGESTAAQSAFTGIGTWAEANFDTFPNGTPCVKDEASRAALNGGSWSCDGMLADGRLIQLATSLSGGRMSLDVLIKRP